MKNVLVLLAFLLLSCQKNVKHQSAIINDTIIEIEEQDEETDTILTSLTNYRDITFPSGQLNEQIKNFLKTQVQEISLDKTKENIIHLKKGTIIRIPKTAIKNFDEPTIKIYEVYDAPDIIFNNISTRTSFGELLVTQGMIKVDFYDGANPKSPSDAYSVSFPKSGNFNPILFKEVIDKNGVVWTPDTTVKYDFVVIYILNIGGFMKDFPELSVGKYDTLRDKKVYNDLKNIENMLSLTYDEKLQIFKEVKKFDNKTEIYDNGFRTEVKMLDFGKYVKIHPGLYPENIIDKVTRVLKEANKSGNDFALDTRIFYIDVVERKYYDSLTRVAEIMKVKYIESQKGEYEYYTFFTTSTGWLNCDAFLESGQREEFIFKSGNLSDNAIVYIKIDKYKSFISVYKTGKTYRTIPIPIELDLTCIIIDENEDGINYDIIKLNQGRRELKEINLHKITFEELKEELKKI